MLKRAIALRILWLVAVAAGLSGCFKSDVPLISADQAVFPFEVITLQTDAKTGESVTYVHDGSAGRGGV